MDQTIHFCSPSVLMAEVGSIREPSLQQHRDFVLGEISNHQLAFGLRNVIPEDCRKRSSSRLRPLLDITQEHSHIRGGGLIVHIRVSCVIKTLVSRCGITLQ